MATYSFKCKDVGMNCGFETSDQNKEGLMGKIANHAKSAHGMASIPADLMKKVEAAIKTK